MKVELIFDRDCPHVEATRAQLTRACGETGLAARWKEWERNSPDSPAYARAYGSPTVLVNLRSPFPRRPRLARGRVRMERLARASAGRLSRM